MNVNAMTNLPDRRWAARAHGDRDTHLLFNFFVAAARVQAGVALHLNAIYYILLILTARIYHFTKGHFSNIIYKFIQIQSRNVVTS